MSGNMVWGKFSLNGYVVYTDAKDAISHKTAFAMPKWTYLISPTYDAGIAAIGLSATGQSSFYLGDETTQAPGSTFVNGFVKVRPMDRLELGFNVNNLFNTLGFRANNGSLAVTGPVTGLAANQAVFDNSAMLGRTMTASIKYRF
jgi:outer membrane receptor protein involved in Fe transport